MSDFKQTWWDENLAKRFEEFESWVGPSGAMTKAYFRTYVKFKEYLSLIDLGCGPATEFSAYEEEYPQLKYLGIDSSSFLYKRNTGMGIPMMKCEAHNVPLPDNDSEVVFSRHVLEHQPTFKPVLNEMIRLAEKEAIHVFFLIPGVGEIINYDPEQNLFHNVYDRKEIEEFLAKHEDVLTFSWIPLTKTEEALSIIKKPSY
jgi:ubiquinone/menaquinone biosynthesis C-methylase UbiE